MSAEIEVSAQVEEGDNKAVTTEVKEQAQPQQQSNPYVEKALKGGWMPKEEWIEAGHSEDDWKPAKAFVEHGELIGKIRKQSTELNSANVALQHLTAKNREVYENGYKAALTQLRAQKRAALADGDLVKADEIDERIDATKDELQQVRAAPIQAPQQQVVDPEHIEWVQRNPWYEKDEIMQTFADSVAIKYINKQKKAGEMVTASEVRDHVEKTVKDEFPQKFPQRIKGAPNPDSEGRSTERVTSSKLDSKLTQAKAGMSDQEKSIMKTIMRSTGMTEADYLKQYSAN